MVFRWFPQHLECAAFFSAIAVRTPCEAGKSLCPCRWGAELLGHQPHRKSEKQCWSEVHILLESLAGPQVNCDLQVSICTQCSYPAAAMCPSHGAASTRLLPACQVLCTRPKKLAIILYYSCRLSLEILFSCSILQWINFQAAGKLLPVIGDKMSPRDTLPMNLLQHGGENAWPSLPRAKRQLPPQGLRDSRAHSVLPILTMSPPSEAMLQFGNPRCQPQPTASCAALLLIRWSAKMEVGYLPSSCLVISITTFGSFVQISQRSRELRDINRPEAVQSQASVKKNPFSGFSVEEVNEISSYLCTGIQASLVLLPRQCPAAVVMAGIRVMSSAINSQFSFYVPFVPALPTKWHMINTSKKCFQF